MPLTLRNKLKALCAFGDGWSYAIFWRFHPRNSMLLTVEEAYYEEQLGEDIANLLSQVQLLGEGIVGEAAFSGKHSWVHSDAQTQEWNLTGQNIYEVDSGLHQQFSSGIKTIAIIPVKAWGVVQFGSKQKILERVEFLEQTQSLLMEIDDDIGMFDASGNAVLSMDCEDNDLNGLLASISSENSWNLKYAHDENSKGLLGKAYTSTSPSDTFPSEYKTYEEVMASLQGDSALLGDQLKGTMEAQVVLSDRDSAYVLLKPNSSMNSLFAKSPCFDACGGELSSFDLLEQQLVSELRAQEVADVCSTNKNAFASSKLLVQDSTLTSLCSMERGPFQGILQSSLDNQFSSQSSVVTDVNFPSNSNTLFGLSASLEPVDMSEEILKFSSMDDLYQWFAPSAEDSSICKAVIEFDNKTFSESIEFCPTSFDPVGCSSLKDNSMACLAGQGSNSDGKETSLVMHGSENGLLDSMKLDFSYDQGDDWWGNLVTPVVSGVSDAGFTESISELNTTDTQTRTNKRLFSELGIEELLKGGENYNNFNGSDLGYELSSSKRQMVEPLPVNRNPTPFSNLHRSEARTDMMQLLCKLDSTNNLPQVGKWIDDSHSINVGKAVPVQLQKPEEPKMPTKKRAKAGESTRPRPKDRQQIQDCIKELRGIIPSGGKCSIDSLLDRTIRYMFFLQSVLKYADKLEEPNEPKLIEQENGVVLRNGDVEQSKNCGITCAFEVAHQTMLCPIIVEDMNPPGQMLIEMLCEEQGFFLEIVDTIRGFGLNILKAKMELRKNKLWARFIVEANKHMTRIDVFWSLMHLLQQTNASSIDSSNKHSNVIGANI
ncbi:hypothetical protein RJT34_23348 [Clitoria ternatea]|uniref:BHLH domain-containing protein n=1 Tax=Clitoria ternatea TaxID=43366 RepID=A0AAN9IL19_CLITE